MPDGHTLTFRTDPAAFLAEAEDVFVAQPVLNTVVATAAVREVGNAEAGLAPDPRSWYLTVRDASHRLVGLGMRTMPFGVRPAYLLPMPASAAVELARTCQDRGEPLLGVNGAITSATACATEAARLRGGEVAVVEHTRLFELEKVIPPREPPGRLRPARAEEVALCQAWHERFVVDAGEQAGRAVITPQPLAASEFAHRIAQQRLWLWVDELDQPVHLTGVQPGAFGATRIGPVFTPKEHRGHGYARAAVSQIAHRILSTGFRPCLFTDQANPTSNAIYQAIGFRPVVDMVNLEVTNPSPSSTSGSSVSPRPT